MTGTVQLLLFALDDRRFAVPLDRVTRVVAAAAITKLPKAPAIVLGLLAWRGKMLAVFDCRARFGLEPRAIRPSDRMVLVRLARREAALLVDQVSGLTESSRDDWIAPDDILEQMPYVAGVVRLNDGTVLIHDLETFLSVEEEAALDGAVAAVAAS